MEAMEGPGDDDDGPIHMGQLLQFNLGGPGWNIWNNHEVPENLTCSIADIMANSPELTSVVIGNADAVDFVEQNNARLLLVSNDIDWARLGRAISKNTVLKHLYFVGLEDGSDPEAHGVNDLVVFKVTQGVLGSKSLESIMFNNCDVACCKEFFARFLRYRLRRRRDSGGLEKFKGLRLTDCEITPRLLSVIAKSLLTFNTLEAFECSLDEEDASMLGINDEDMSVVLEALVKKHKLKNLALEGVQLGLKSLGHVRSMLKRKGSRVEALKLMSCDINDEAFNIISADLVSNGSIQELDLSGNEVGVVSREGIASLLRRSKTLKTLRAEFCLAEYNRAYLRASEAEDLSESLRCCNSLETLHLQAKTSNLGWQCLGNYFGNANRNLRDLKLSDCNLLSEDFGVLTSAIVSNPKLVSLCLEGNPHLTDGDWRVFADRVMQSSVSKLENLHLVASFSEESISSIILSLRRNKTLKSLEIDYDDDPEEDEHEPAFTDGHWEELDSVLSDSAGIMETYHSNHRLMSVSDGGDPPHRTKMLLEINAEGNDFLAARTKIISNHFFVPSKDIKPLLRVAMNALPQVASWIGCRHGKEEFREFSLQVDCNIMYLDFNIMYEFVRNSPFFIEQGVDGTSVEVPPPEWKRQKTGD